MLSAIIDKNSKTYRLYDKALLWLLLIFFTAHTINHLAIYFGAANHIDLMEALRIIYRNPVFEFILIWAIARQIYAGYRQSQKFGLIRPKGQMRVLIWTGVYLIAFLLIHLSAVTAGRYIFNLDTNIHFGASGFRAMPAALFFYPYYFLAIFCAFAHLGGVLWLRKRAAEPENAEKLFRFWLATGLVISTLIIIGVSGSWQDFEIPPAYMVLY